MDKTTTDHGQDGDVSGEKRKWDAYYARLRDEEPPAGAVEVLYRELADTMASIVPKGSRMLEAGCGSGRNSLALAQLGGFEVTLLDFSEEAIAYARRTFADAGIPAQFEVGDVLGAGGAPEYELVFNSGVLEHYEFERQVAFLRGMKARTKRYVFVLVPNRACYWYWIWRIRAAADGEWPFGYEKPASDYRPALEAAGLHYLGRVYLGAGAIDEFLAGVPGLDAGLRELVAAIHGRQLVPLSQRAYLVGFLASLRKDDPLPSGFYAEASLNGEPMGDWADRYIALAADALAGQIAAEQRVARLEKEVSELHKKLITAQAERLNAPAASNAFRGSLGRLIKRLSGRH